MDIFGGYSAAVYVNYNCFIVPIKHTDGLVLDCSYSSVLAVELLLTYIKLSVQQKWD